MASKVDRMLERQEENESPSPNPEASPSPSENPETSPPSSLGADLDTSHLDDLADEIEREEKAERGEAAYAARKEAPAGCIPKDDFFAMFQLCFHMPNLVPVPPFPLECLPIKPEEMQAARAASDAIYDIAAESEYLRWLVEPGSVWMQRVMAIGPFVAVKAMAIRAEIASRRPDPVAGSMPEAPAQASPPVDTGEPKSDASTVIELAA